MSILQKYYDYKSYRACRDLFKIHSKSYYLGAMIFPFYKFKHVCAIYGLVRIADNIVDYQITDIHEIEEKKKKLEKFIFNFFSIYDLSERGYKLIENDNKFWDRTHVVFRALFKTIKEVKLERNLFERFFKSMKVDLCKFKYESYNDLEEYMDGSAAVVGEIMLKIMMHNDNFYKDEKSFSRKCYAQILGNAFQLTNFIRDIHQDINMIPSRIYLPSIEINRYKLDFDHYNSIKCVDEKFIRFIKDQIMKNRMLYSLSDIGINMLSENDKCAINLSRILYSKILNKIEKKNYELFMPIKIKLDFSEKLNLIYQNIGFIKFVKTIINYILYSYFFILMFI